MHDSAAHVLVSLMALGMALAFVSADRHSRISRMLAAGFAFLGLGVCVNVVVPAYFGVPRAWSGWLALPEALSMLFVLEWVLAVRRTTPAAADLNTRTGDRVLRVGQAAALLYALFSVLWPELRLTAFAQAAGQPQLLHNGGFWLFFAPMLLAMLAGMFGIFLLLNRRPERAETVRVLAMAAAAPFLVAGAILPLHWSALSAGFGEILFFVGAVHYHVQQGQRGQFMSRFLSPQVARLVAEQGLERAMQESSREITVVCCDLRGFTAYASAQSSAQVLQVLREYYDASGQVVAEFGATIKDFAGDGILILVGAPLPIPYHASRGIEMAARIRTEVQKRMPHWSTPTHQLGVGFGVATGVATVGVIGSASRLEYTAVGSVVNLASRLCEQARDGEILVDARTIELAGSAGLMPRPALTVKGFSAPVSHALLPV